MDLENICNKLDGLQRERVFLIKAQSRADRSVENYVRRTFTAWHRDLPEEERDAENDKALALIAAARKGEPVDKKIVRLVTMSDAAREPIDRARRDVELDMEKTAKQLPVWEWAEGVLGFAEKGLAIIVAETTTESAPLSLSSYRIGLVDPAGRPSKGLDGIYSRLGFASYGLPDDGGQFALSSWKRHTWTPRKLTADEWKAHPFKAARYAEMFTLAESLFKAQILGAETQYVLLPNGSERRHKGSKPLPKGAVVVREAPGVRTALGPYGEAYLARRARTAVAHPEWSDMHAHRDAMRVMFKALIADLYAAWLRLTPIAADGASARAPETAKYASPRSAAPPTAEAAV